MCGTRKAIHVSAVIEGAICVKYFKEEKSSPDGHKKRKMPGLKEGKVKDHHERTAVCRRPYTAVAKVCRYNGSPILKVAF